MVKFEGVDWSKVNYILTTDGFKFYLKDFKLDHEAAYLGKLQLFRTFGTEGHEVHLLEESEAERIVNYGDHVVFDYTAIAKELAPSNPETEVLPNLEDMKKIGERLLLGEVSAAKDVVRMLTNQSSNDHDWEMKRQFLLDLITNTSDTVRSMDFLLVDV